jgi:glycosyltransferase involved in cell wall biosynthesis
LHALTSNFDLITSKYDVALLCNAANSPFAWMIRALGIPLAINVDGIERMRSKWNSLGRAWYRLGEYCSTVFASKVIGDADVICKYYKERYNTESVMIPYGAKVEKRSASETLNKFNLFANNYILYVSRLEPENNALGVIEAYKKISTSNTPPLVIVGDAPYADAYKQNLRQLADGANVIFTGFQFGQAYQELRSNCLCYVQATEVGGTHPALVEALAYGNPTIVNGTPENIEVVKDAALIYDKNNFDQLSELLTKLISSEQLRNELTQKAIKRANSVYTWEAVVDAYEDLLFALAAPGAALALADDTVSKV